MSSAAKKILTNVILQSCYIFIIPASLVIVLFLAWPLQSEKAWAVHPLETCKTALFAVAPLLWNPLLQEVHHAPSLFQRQIKTYFFQLTFTISFYFLIMIFCIFFLDTWIYFIVPFCFMILVYDSCYILIVILNFCWELLWIIQEDNIQVF